MPTTELNRYDCGCRIIRDSASSTFMLWCPTHQAAKEMLEALTQLVCYLDPEHYATIKPFADARTAIAKATAG